MRWFIIIGLSTDLSPRSEFPGSCPLFTFTNRGFSSFALREWLNPCPTCASAQLLLFYKVEYILRSMDRQSLRVWRVAHWIILRCGCVSSAVVTRWLSDGREVTNGVPWIMWGWYSFGETNPLGRSESSSRTRCEVLFTVNVCLMVVSRVRIHLPRVPYVTCRYVISLGREITILSFMEAASGWTY